jgi:hypothetical protein
MNVVKPEIINTSGSFTRASTGTYFDSTGLLKIAGVNEARPNHDLSTGEFQGILFEDATTNLILQSETLNVSPWTLGGMGPTLSANYSIAPDGTMTADKLVEGSSNGFYYINAGAAGVIGNLETLSIFAKASGRSTLSIYLGSDNAFYNLVLGTTSGAGARMEYVKNGWYRCYLTRTRATNTSNSFYCAEGTNVFITGGGPTVGLELWGAQLESGEGSSYVGKTTTAPVSRAADAILGSGLLYTNLVNANADWSSATTYALGQSVSYGFSTYTSLQNSNTNQNPETATAYWVRVGPTNRTAMFDSQVSTAGTSSESIILVLKIEPPDTIALLNLLGSKAEVAINDGTTKELMYHFSQSLQGNITETWLDYFEYNSNYDKTQAIFLNVPKVSSSILSVKITGTGTVKIGSFISGIIDSIGASQYGASAGIIDYSRKETDSFGNTTFVVRNFSKRLSTKVSLTNPNVNRVQRLLYGLRATPALWIASTDTTFEEPLIVFGFYRDFSTEIAYPSHSLCNLEIEGLI